MTLPSLDVPALLRRYGLRPDKSLGQNFLIDQVALQRVAGAAEIQNSDTVLEIGAGLGSLTRHLALQSRLVIAIELDAKLIPALKEVVGDTPNVQVIQGDILTLNLTEILGWSHPGSLPDYLVVANIPYYITSTLIRYMLEISYPPRRLVLTVQKEVAERISASPGNMSLLSLSVQVYGSAQVIAPIPAGAFYPIPQVDSAIVRVNRFSQPLIPNDSLPIFFRLAKAGFSQKRKTLRNALAGGMHWTPGQAEAFLVEAGIESKRRAETLSLEEWRKLVAIVKQFD